MGRSCATVMAFISRSQTSVRSARAADRAGSGARATRPRGPPPIVSRVRARMANDRWGSGDWWTVRTGTAAPGPARASRKPASASLIGRATSGAAGSCRYGSGAPAARCRPGHGSRTPAARPAARPARSGRTGCETAALERRSPPGYCALGRSQSKLPASNFSFMVTNGPSWLVRAAAKSRSVKPRRFQPALMSRSLAARNPTSGP